MKTSARFLAMLLAVVMIASAALSVSAFDDVAGNKHANAINVLTQLGVIGGYGDGTFKPDQKVTRAEMAKLVYVLYTTFVDAGTAKTAFTDVADDHWATGYINWCSQQDIIGGYGDGKFGPNDNVTYDQALKMVCGVLGYKGFQSNLWPTDVRMTALRTLELGEELEDVKGGDQLTRAQVAQIMYNALNADMNETKTVQVPLGDTGYTVPVTVAKKLAVDIWKFTEVPYTVDGTENFGSKTGEEDTIKLSDGKTYELADLGLEKYEGKTDALIGLEIMTLVDSVKNEMLAAATVSGSVVDGVEVTYNKAQDTLTVNGVKYTAEKKAEDELKLWTLGAGDSLVTDGDIFSKDNKDGEDVLIADAIVAALDASYMARAIDVEGDGEVDGIVIVPVNFFTVSSIKKDTNKTIVLAPVAGGSNVNVATADLTVAVEKDDMVAVANLGGIYYGEIIEGVESYATKINENDKKVTLDGIGVVEYTEGQISASSLGEDYKATFYVYDGKLVAQEGLKAATEYSIAILKEVEVTDEKTLNQATMRYETAYIATLIVDGVETKVNLASEGNAIVGAKDYTAAAALDAFKVDDSTATPVYNYTLVSAYEENDDGEYVLTIDKALNAEDDMMIAGTISYDADKKYYVVKDVNDNNKGYRVVLDENSVIFYTYTDEIKTGDFKHIASYDAESITNKTFSDKPLKGNAYITYDEVNKNWVLIAAMVDGEIKGVVDGEVNYTTDGTLVLYAPESSSKYSKNGKTYLEHIFKGVDAPVANEAVEANKATETVAGNFYGWDADAEVYVPVNDIATFQNVVLKDVFHISGVTSIEYDLDGATLDAPIADDITIWGLGLDEDEKAVLDAYKELTVDELEAMLADVAAVNADDIADNDIAAVDAILVRAIDYEKSSGTDYEYTVKGIIVNIFEEDENGDLVAINGALFTK
ncbi:MAG: S-layer homology domain-containing protein [Clostridia bacterium]|nr:S-layer homology domain-containing protein [Clostridia bacterium]